jgi:hypothetical protein
MSTNDITALAKALDASFRGRRNNFLFDFASRRALEHLIEVELPDADAAVAAAIFDAHYEEQTPLQYSFARNKKSTKGYAVKVASIAIDLMRNCKDASVEEAVERAVGYACGPAISPWEYVCINLAPEDSKPTQISDWQLAKFDYANDPTLPVEGAPGMASDPSSPRQYHGSGYGILRRPIGNPPVPFDDEVTRVLVWPLLALNLVLTVPIIAGPHYLVEPGRSTIVEHAGWPQPSETNRWGYSHDPSSSHDAFVVSTGDSPQLAKFCKSFQTVIDSLDMRCKSQLARAADHFLFVKCHIFGGPEEETQISTLHASESAFRLTAALECLLTGGDSGRTDLSRKVQQRAAMLIGESDSDRLGVREVVSMGYSARSAYAHGDKERKSDLLALRSVTQRVMIAWVSLAAHCMRQQGRQGGKSGLPNVLDDSLLSRDIFRDHVIKPQEAFWREAGNFKEIRPRQRSAADYMADSLHIGRPF